jgi:hypothetical protein
MYALVATTIAWFGCGTQEPPAPERQASALAAPSPTPAASQARMFCSDVGGTCRKSACRANEVLSTRFQCGTDAACCVPR